MREDNKNYNQGRNQSFNRENRDNRNDQRDSKYTGQSYRTDDYNRQYGQQSGRDQDHYNNQYNDQGYNQTNRQVFGHNSSPHYGENYGVSNDSDNNRFENSSYMSDNFSSSRSNQDQQRQRESQSQYQPNSDWNNVGQRSGFGNSNQRDHSYGQQYQRPYDAQYNNSSREQNSYTSYRPYGADQGSYGQDVGSNSRYQGTSGYNSQDNDAQRSIYGSAAFGSLGMPGSGMNAMNARSSMYSQSNQNSYSSPSQGYRGSSFPDYYTSETGYGYGSGSNYQNQNSNMSSGMNSNPGKQTPASYYGKGPKSFKRSDDRIREEISEIFTRHHDVDASDIEVEVKEGEVTLTGFVPDRRMKYLAEDLAEKSMGVKDVVNNIRVKRDDSLYSDSSLTESERNEKKAGASGASTSGKKGSSPSTLNPNH